MSTPLNATAASILGLLTWKPMSGWDLYGAFEETIGQFWSVSRSQVYRELRTLAAAGLIEIGATGARERRLCTIQPAGRRVFSEWIARDPGNELIRFPLLLTTFFADAVPPERLRAMFVEQRRTHAEQLASYERQLPEVRAHAPIPALTLEFGIGYERAVIAWIDGLPWMKKAR
jgi:DNA-binding PadR family transcriptional regulator